MTVKNEELRSRVWRIVMTGSTLVIVVIAVFFLVRMFRENPIEGTWNSEDFDMVLTVKGNSSIEVKIPEILEGEDVKVELDYAIDKDEKTLSIKLDETNMDSIIEKSDGTLTEEIVTSCVGPLLTTFDYSVDEDEMTLTEREYGEQYTFIKE
ncbi:MAG: hypothetical protein Q4B75_05285 [Eubacteriales bacterium]|nr:hypothetical protein [Eubacteriales bacterium]